MPLERVLGNRIDLLFTGTVFCDLVFSGVPETKAGTEVYADAFGISPGGTANRAVAAARLGARTALLSPIGTDPLGALVHTALEKERNLDLRLVERREDYSTPVTVSLSGAHDRSFITYEDPAPSLRLPEDVGGIGAAHVGVAGPLPDWVRRLRATGTVIVGGVGWDSTGLWSRDALDRLQDVDVFVPNDAEAMRYTRTESAADAARALGRDVGLAVVTRGKDGVVAYDSGTGALTEIPAIRVEAIDPTGAGDVFVASFMAALRHDWSLEDRLRFAGLCASVSVTRIGGAASAPEPADISRYLRENQPPGDWSTVRDWAASQSPHSVMEAS